jgi:hypothetical protein
MIENEAQHGIGRGSGHGQQVRPDHTKRLHIGLAAHGSRPINKAMPQNGKNEKSP